MIQSTILEMRSFSISDIVKIKLALFKNRHDLVVAESADRSILSKSFFNKRFFFFFFFWVKSVLVVFLNQKQIKKISTKPRETF